ncbi:MAG TPA: sugar phosphate nucleotidyltransferase, partial [Thermoanaerobaculia bacterium]
NILTEPARRNTAPAIAVAVAEIEKRLPGVTIGVFPSDHAVGDVDAFLTVVHRAFAFAERSDYLVTLGITPSEPNTGFGYLELGDELAPGIRKTLRYVEKPTRERAEELIRHGHVWNGGMFLWKASVFRAVLRAAAPDIAEIAERITFAATDAEKRALYETMPSISIDFGVMEKAERVATAPGEFMWSDVGSWSAVARLAPSEGGAILEQATGVYVVSDSGRRIAVVGLDGVAVVDSTNGLLVVRLEESEAVSEVVKKLRS